MKKWLIGGMLGCLGSTVGSVAAFFLLVVVLVVALLGGAAKSDSGVQVAAASGPYQPGSVTSLAWTGKKNKDVVNAALIMADGLLMSTSGRMQSYGSKFPQEVINFWSSACSGCNNWQNGRLQCVAFVFGSYGWANQRPPWARHGFMWWGDYANLAGWERIANGSTGHALPGDILAMSGGPVDPETGISYGHVAVVVDVRLPDGPGKPGSVTFAQANAGKAIDAFQLTVDGGGRYTLHAWPGYWAQGYIRHSNYVS